MKGMNAQTGEIIDNIEQVKQSVTDILTVPHGSRVMRRDYGAGLTQFIDAPMNPYVICRMQSVLANALSMQQDQLSLEEIFISSNQTNPSDLPTGSFTVSLKGTYVPEGKDINIEDIYIKL